jgi:hypothetical protein
MSSIDKIIFQGFVINNQDPLMLGRIRAIPVNAIESQLLPQDWTPNKEWTQDDPLIYLPLLPYYLSQVPKVDEYIHIFFYNKKQQIDNTKFYIQGPITRPQNNFFEDWHNSESLLATGPFLKQANNIKEGTTVKGEAYGIYPEPGDNGLLGRGTSDIIIKKSDVSDDVLIRSGKNIQSQTSGFNIPTPRENRAFLQVSLFELEKEYKDPVTKRFFEQESLFVKKLIEWDITEQITITGYTSGGGVTGTTAYNGDIKLYSLPSKDRVKTSEIKETTPLDDIKGIPEYIFGFTGKTLDEGVKIINEFISGVNNGKINIDNEQYPSNGPGAELRSQFPFYFRPTKSSLDKLSSSGPKDFNMINNFYNRIKLLPSNRQFGSVLVWQKNVIGEQLTLKIEEVEEPIYKVNPVSYTTLGSDFVYLLSHKTDIPSKSKINLGVTGGLSTKNTLYGIKQEYYTDTILPNTDPMVRGNELMKLLKLIVDFIGSHVHNINEVPIGIGTDGTKLEDIRKILQDADNSILNQNIRIN